jgi:hypothetical protein
LTVVQENSLSLRYISALLDARGLRMSKIEAWVDTNTFLHFKALDELDWSVLTGASEITVVVCAAVIGELDNQKNHGATPKLRERARDSIRRLHHWRKTDIARRVRLRLVADEPPVDWAREGLDQAVRDDRIIGSILTQTLGGDQAVVTGDMNLTLKAEGRGIRVINLPDSDRLPDIKSEHDTELMNLKRQLAEAKDREPRLKVVFAGQSGGDGRILRVHLDRVTLPTEADIRTRVAAKKIELEQVATAYRAQPHSPFWPIEDEVGRFVQAIPGYLADYEEWIRDDTAYQESVSRTVKIALRVVNEGRGTADGLRAVVHVPDGPDVHDELPERPALPEPPRKPLTLAETMQQGIGLSVLPRSYHPYIPNINLKPGLDIKKTNSFDITWTSKELMHGLAEDIDDFYCTWPSLDAVESFTISYTIFSRNLPVPTKGELSVVIEVA